MIWKRRGPKHGDDALGPDTSTAEQSRLRQLAEDVERLNSAGLGFVATDAIRARIKRLGLRRRWP